MARSSMNAYLITDMPGMFTVTPVDRAIYFYRQLSYELLAYASDEDVVCHLTADQAHVRRSFGNAYCNIDNAKVPITEFEKRAVLEKWKTLLNQLITFYENSELSGKDVPEIVKWRWAHMSVRAKKWQETAQTYDWACFLCIYPELTGESWWWHDAG